MNTFDSFSSKRVSFCLATKDKAPYLEKALESFRDSGLITSKDELIIVDGNSADGTQEVVKKFSDIVTVFISEPDTSGQHAINKAFLLASGKYIKYLTDDDIYYSKATEQAVAIMEQHPEIDMLLCGGTKERNGRVWDYYVPRGIGYGRRSEDLFKYRGATGVGHFFRRSSLAKIGVLYPRRPSADSAFVLDFIKNGGVVRFCRINAYHHTIYDHSWVVAHRGEHIRDTFALCWEYCSFWFYIQFRFLTPFKKFIIKVYGKIIRSYLKPVPAVLSSEIWDGELS